MNFDDLSTLFAQADGMIDPTTGGVVPPIQPATTFARNEDYSPISADHIYARDQNDLLRLGEKILAKSEQADDGLLFPSGMAAIAAVFRTVPNGGRVIVQSGIYWGATQWIRNFCERRQIELIEVDCTDVEQLRASAQSANLVWVETPSNPYLKTCDIAACKEIAQSMNAQLVVDSTAATPVHCQPITLGADLVMHSATKGINGHSDVLAGFLATADKESDVWKMIANDRYGAGAMLGSFEAWLLIRGMRTLPLRMKQMSASAQQLAEFCQSHNQVEAVLYPGLADDPGHETAKRQMKDGFGSLLSIILKGDKQNALDVTGRLKLFKRATSLGGVESLVEHRHTIEQAVPETLLRLSVGIEATADLISDLKQALDG